MFARKLHLPVTFWIAVIGTVLVVSLLAAVAPKQLVPGAATMVGFLIVCFMPRILKAMIGYERRLSIYEQVRALADTNTQVWDNAEASRAQPKPLQSHYILSMPKRETNDCDEPQKPEVRQPMTGVAH